MIEAVISSSVLITIIILVRMLFKGKIKSSVRYSLWLIAAIRLMLPFELFSSPVSVMNAAEIMIPQEMVSESENDVPGVLRGSQPYQSENFSVTSELKKMQSSLYYPDIVAQMGANPEMFAIEMTVKIKNISSEENSFDCSELVLLSGDNALYMFDTNAEEAENIKSGKSVTLNLRALCTLSQAEEISGMSYCGGSFEVGESFIPDSFADVIDIQSADDVLTHLYRQFLYRNSGDYYMFSFSEPASICAHMLGRAGENNEYFAIEYSVTNRSDYALMIDPNNYLLSLVYDNPDENGEAELMYISTDEELMYEPKEAGKIDGVEKIYEMPDFICMKPEGSTDFTIVYKPKGHITKWYMMCAGHDEPYFAQYECVLGKECDY